ncbi:MAG: putative metalloprotease [Methylophilaceae bacterium]|jgi:predicted metalloprotease
MLITKVLALPPNNAITIEMRLDNQRESSNVEDRNRMREIVEACDVEEAMRAASAIGDDAFQKQVQGYAVPDSFTYDKSKQRMRLFNQGLKVGDVNKSNKFSASDVITA